MRDIFDLIKPTPSDFADYVYCPRCWALDKRPATRRIKKLRGASYDKKEGKESYENLIIGQNNEHKCIEWVMNKFNASTEDILFNGTGKNNLDFLTSEISTFGVNMQCKPDLIIKMNNRSLLFEFKAVKDCEYLKYEEFDSVQAQVWCYTFLKEIPIDSCNVFRYFKDPSTKEHTQLRQISALVFNSSKFEDLFKNYIQAIEIMSQNGKAGDATSILKEPASHQDVKCRHCAYNDLICNPKHLLNGVF